MREFPSSPLNNEEREAYIVYGGHLDRYAHLHHLVFHSKVGNGP